MLNYILKDPKHESFYKKYASKKFLKVSVQGSLPPLSPAYSLLRSAHTYGSGHSSDGHKAGPFYS